MGRGAEANIAKGGRMTDFEIRYFHADGTLALVFITAQATALEAEEHAKSNQDEFARFEVREIKPARA